MHNTYVSPQCTVASIGGGSGGQPTPKESEKNFLKINCQIVGRYGWIKTVAGLVDPPNFAEMTLLAMQST